MQSLLAPSRSQVRCWEGSSREAGKLQELPPLRKASNKSMEPKQEGRVVPGWYHSLLWELRPEQLPHNHQNLFDDQVQRTELSPGYRVDCSSWLWEVVATLLDDWERSPRLGDQAARKRMNSSLANDGNSSNGFVPGTQKAVLL